MNSRPLIGISDDNKDGKLHDTLIENQIQHQSDKTVSLPLKDIDKTKTRLEAEEEYENEKHKLKQKRASIQSISVRKRHLTTSRDIIRKSIGQSRVYI